MLYLILIMSVQTLSPNNIMITQLQGQKLGTVLDQLNIDHRKVIYHGPRDRPSFMEFRYTDESNLEYHFFLENTHDQEYTFEKPDDQSILNYGVNKVVERINVFARNFENFWGHDYSSFNGQELMLLFTNNFNHTLVEAVELPEKYLISVKVKGQNGVIYCASLYLEKKLTGKLERYSKEQSVALKLLQFKPVSFNFYYMGPDTPFLLPRLRR